MSNPPNQAVDTLLTALDEIDLGIVLLDSNLRTKFINRAFLHIYRLADKSGISNCDFEDLMRFVIRKRRVLAPSEFNSYIKRRVREVRAGIEDVA